MKALGRPLEGRVREDSGKRMELVFCSIYVCLSIEYAQNDNHFAVLPVTQHMKINVSKIRTKTQSFLAGFLVTVADVVLLAGFFRLGFAGFFFVAPSGIFRKTRVMGGEHVVHALPSSRIS